MAVLPEDLRLLIEPQLKGMDEEARRRFLQRLVQAQELTFRPLAEADVATIKVAACTTRILAAEWPGICMSSDTLCSVRQPGTEGRSHFLQKLCASALARAHTCCDATGPHVGDLRVRLQGCGRGLYMAGALQAKVSAQPYCTAATGRGA